MSPEAKCSFEAEWAALSRRLRLLLVRKRVSPAQHDDLLQETALRLVSMWDSVDRRRELWPLTVTIALNLLRDRDRVTNKDDLVGDMPELRSLTDVETAGIARIELSKVRQAMNQLSESHRSILMKEVGGHSGAALPDGAADKMLRMRARRKLRSALEKVSGLVALRIRRLGDLFEGLVVLKETGMTAASCAFCLALGVGGTVLAPAALVPEASAGPVRQGVGAMSFVTPPLRSAAAADGLRHALAEARAAGENARLLEATHRPERGQADRRTRAKDRSSTASASDLGGTLPLGHGGDDVQDAPSMSLPADDSPQPLPAEGGDEEPSLPPTSEPPSPPVPSGPSDDSAGDPLGGAAEVVDRLL